MAVYEKDRLDWVSQSIESMLAQTFTDFLYYIVVDGPIDDTCKKYLLDVAQDNSRIVLIFGKHNVGLSECMNFIIELSAEVEPRYLVRMDADDISKKHRIQTQKQFLDAHDDISVVGSALSEIDENGKIIGERKLPLSHDAIVKLLPKRCPLNHPTVMIRYDVFSKGFRYMSGLNITEDYFLWADLAADGCKFSNLESNLLLFRRVDEFYKRRGIKRSFSEFRARFYTMKKLNRFSVTNVLYAFIVLFLRSMPLKVVKLAYRVDRFLWDKLTKH
ncbi:glycosyltransferase [Alteromonas sp. 5E99-2]|nr:glycosyltransferase [Alteromonas sp. 5E99-2]